MNLTDGAMRTYSGQSFHPLAIVEEDLRIVDVAYALSMIPRYGGHAHGFYSVAQHSVEVSHLCRNRYGGLLHDATECFLGDVVRPLKQCLPEYRVLEAKLWEAIARRFQVPALGDDVHWADNVALNTERRELFDRTPQPGEDVCKRTKLQALGRLVGWRGGWPSFYARRRFLRRFCELAPRAVLEREGLY